MADAVIEKTKEHFEQSYSSLACKFAAIRASRANASLLDRIQVKYYGATTLPNQLAPITVPEAYILLISSSDKSSLEDIEHATNTPDLGIDPANDGSVIHLVIPMLTEETRKELTKEVKKVDENVKVAIRNIRRDTMNETERQEKAKETIKDELKALEKDIQKVTDEAIRHINTMAANRERELLEV